MIVVVTNTGEEGQEEATIGNTKVVREAGEDRADAGDRDLVPRELVSPVVKCPMIASNVLVDFTGRGDRLLGVRDSLALLLRLRDLRE